MIEEEISGWIDNADQLDKVKLQRNKEEKIGKVPLNQNLRSYSLCQKKKILTRSLQNQISLLKKRNHHNLQSTSCRKNKIVPNFYQQMSNINMRRTEHLIQMMIGSSSSSNSLQKNKSHNKR